MTAMNEAHAAPCPKCGHCPTCGRSNQPNGFYPSPYYPWGWYWQHPAPTVKWTSSTAAAPSTITVNSVN